MLSQFTKTFYIFSKHLISKHLKVFLYSTQVKTSENSFLHLPKEILNYSCFLKRFCQSLFVKRFYFSLFYNNFSYSFFNLNQSKLAILISIIGIFFIKIIRINFWVISDISNQLFFFGNVFIFL